MRRIVTLELNFFDANTTIAFPLSTEIITMIELSLRLCSANFSFLEILEWSGFAVRRTLTHSKKKYEGIDGDFDTEFTASNFFQRMTIDRNTVLSRKSHILVVKIGKYEKLLLNKIIFFTGHPLNGTSYNLKKNLVF